MTSAPMPFFGGCDSIIEQEKNPDGCGQGRFGGFTQVDECADIVNAAPFSVCDIFQSVPHLGLQSYGCSVPVDRDVSAQKSRFGHIKFDYRFVCFIFHLSPTSVFRNQMKPRPYFMHPKVVFLKITCARV